MRIALLSHCNFLGNSAMHVFSIATELQRLGHKCVIGVPTAPETVLRHRKPTFPVLHYDDLINNPQMGGKPDLLHVWTPREHVRIATEAFVKNHHCPYIVHLEDNEVRIVENENPKLDYETILRLPEDVAATLIGSDRAHPRRFPKFIAGAAGLTCLIDRLAEFRAEDQPVAIFAPGFDEEFGKIQPANDSIRSKYGIRSDEIVFLYNGNVHASVLDDVRVFYLALADLYKRGLPIRLIKTGWDYADPMVPEALHFKTDLGFVDREEVPVLMSLADILVQPGRADTFNDYRVPSKLPEYLASGKPVILPESNIGYLMEDGKQALKLREGTVAELIGQMERLLASQELRSQIGQAGREFAFKALSWSNAGRVLNKFYEDIRIRGNGYTSKKRAHGLHTSQFPAAGTVNYQDTQRKDDPDLQSNRSASDADAFPTKLIAFYHPQFHPVPKNDRWWGDRFTTWSEVGRARPRFPGHLQPRCPTELGYYDHSIPAVMQEQVSLARAYGIHAFCFNYYWDSGHTALEQPCANWFDRAGCDFPFLICWANAARPNRESAINSPPAPQQIHRPDDESFIREVIPILKDSRYVHVDNAPVLLVSQVELLPEPLRTTHLWRRVCAENGLERLHLVSMQSLSSNDPRTIGFDSTVRFPPLPHGKQCYDPRCFRDLDSGFEGEIGDYIKVAEQSINDTFSSYPVYRGIIPGWDSSGRADCKSLMLINDSPKAYGQWLRILSRKALEQSGQQAPLIFVNSWNAWAEGAYLEPDARYDRGLLEVTRCALVQALLDYARGPNDERERVFTANISRLPKPL